MTLAEQFPNPAPWEMHGDFIYVPAGSDTCLMCLADTCWLDCEVGEHFCSYACRKEYEMAFWTKLRKELK